MRNRFLLAAVVLAVCSCTVAEARQPSIPHSEVTPTPARIVSAGLAGTLESEGAMVGGTCGTNCCVDCGVDYGPLWSTYCMEKQCMHARLATVRCRLLSASACGTCKPTSCTPHDGARARTSCDRCGAGCDTGCDTGCRTPSQSAGSTRYYIGDPPKPPPAAEKAPDPALPPEPQELDIEAPESQSARRAPAKRVGVLQRLRSR